MSSTTNRVVVAAVITLDVDTIPDTIALELGLAVAHADGHTGPIPSPVVVHMTVMDEATTHAIHDAAGAAAADAITPNRRAALTGVVDLFHPHQEK
ncbi:MAG: hypothetical protein RR101_15435 [Burkholderiaceae bacterium]